MHPWSCRSGTAHKATHQRIDINGYVIAEVIESFEGTYKWGMLYRSYIGGFVEYEISFSLIEAKQKVDDILHKDGYQTLRNKKGLVMA